LLNDPDISTDHQLSTFNHQLFRDRGLRGWTRLVYSAYLGHRADSPLGRRQKIADGSSKLGRPEDRSSKLEVSSSKLETSSPELRTPSPAALSPNSYLPSSAAGQTPNSYLLTPTRMRPRRILVFRIGQLGDTIAALPAMWAVRDHFPDAELTLLCDR